MGRTVYDMVLLKLKAIRNPELESTLKFLNFKQSMSLLFYLEHYLRNDIEVELSARAALYLIKTYEKGVIQQVESLRPLLHSISVHLRHRFKEQRNTVGVNIAALKILSKDVSSKADQDFGALFREKGKQKDDPFAPRGEAGLF